MPYMPTNMYPRNCAVEMTEDGYTFLATVDNQDYVDNVELQVWDEQGRILTAYTEKEDDSIVKKIKINNQNFILDNVDWSTPPYQEGNEIIKYVLPYSISNNNESGNNINFSIKECTIIPYDREDVEQEGVKLTSMHKSYHIYCKVSFKIYEESSEESVGTFTGYYQTVSNFHGGDIDQDKKYEMRLIKSSFLESTDVNNTISNIRILYPEHVYMDFTPTGFPYGSNSINNCFYQISLSNFGFEYKYNSEICQFFISTQQQNKLSFSGNPVFKWNTNSGYDRRGNQENSIQEIFGTKQIFVVTASYESILKKDSKLNWNLILLGSKYDRHIESGILEGTDKDTYLITPFSGLIKEGDTQYFRLNNHEFNVESNSYYYYKIAVMQVTQSKKESDGFYTYTIFKEGWIPDKELPGEYENGTFKLHSKYLSLFLGTEEIIMSDNNFQVDSENIQFKSKLSFLGTEESTYPLTQRIAITIERMQTEISFTNSGISFNTGDPYGIYSNRLDSTTQQFIIVESSPLQIELSQFNKELKLFLNYSREIRWYQYYLYENNQLIFKSNKDFKKFLPQELSLKRILFEPNNNYSCTITICDENGLIKSQKSTEITFNEISFQNKGYGEYDIRNGINYIHLSNILGLPYYNNSTQELMWTNSSGEVWTDQEVIIDTNSMAIMSLRASVYRNMYKDKVETYHDEFWGIDNQQIQKNNEIEESILILDNKELFPINSNNYDNTLYDYGITKGKSYDYEIYYEAEVVDIGIHYFGVKSDDSSNPYITSLNYIFNPYTKQLLNFELKISSSPNKIFSEFSNDGSLKINVKLGETTSVDISFNEDGSINSIIRKQNESAVSNIDYPTLSSNPFISENSYTIQLPPIKTNIITTDDWMGVSLYGTNYIYDENKENRYELNPNQVWHFDLDTKADLIDFTNERNVFVNASSIPKVGVSNVNYMTQSITSKLGYLTEAGEYIEDTKNRLDKFVDFSQDGTVKILRLRNGYLIPVDIAVKSNAGNYTVEGEPSDITFTWTQVEDHKSCVLYSLEQGVKY